MAWIARVYSRPPDGHLRVACVNVVIATVLWRRVGRLSGDYSAAASRAEGGASEWDGGDSRALDSKTLRRSVRPAGID